MDLNRDGWTDLLIACHRNDIGHRVDSLIYWNTKTRFDLAHPTRLPGLGPHGMTARDRGNAFTRKPEESYVSPTFKLAGLPVRLDWIADVPKDSQSRFQLRWGDTEGQLRAAEWCGLNGKNTFYETRGAVVCGVPGSAHLIQSRATFVSLYGGAYPALKEVRIDFRKAGGSRIEK